MHQESLHRYQRHDFKQKLDIMLSSPQSYTVAVVRSLKDNRIYAFLRGANLCFSESRAASGGINGGSHRLDMRFCGTLAQYIVIAGPRDIAMNTERKYEDFNVWSITPQLMGRESSYGLT
jgi:hypothetical protein